MQNIELKQVLQEQHVEAINLQSLWKLREATEQFQELIRSSRLIKVVIGIRRSGKSTLCLGAIPSDCRFSYVNFDDERLTGLKTKDLNRIYEILLELQPQTDLFVFDEIQNVAAWELFISRLHRKKLNLIVTGSNGKLLSKDLATHLTGRHVSLELMPLSFAEFLKFQSVSYEEIATTEARALIKNKLQIYFECGGFPEVVLGEPPGIYLRELFDKIISRDISQRYQLRRTQTLKEVASYLVQQSGSVTSLDRLQTAFDISSKTTLRSYLQYLQEVFLIYEVQGYSSKLKERTTRPRKYYACDLGLWSALNTKPTQDLGMKLETLVFLQLKRLFPQVFYLKEQGLDIDFCLLRDRRPEKLVQVSYTLQNSLIRKREVRSLVVAAQRYGLTRGWIITWDETERFVEQGVHIEVMPVWKFLLTPFNAADQNSGNGFI